MKHPELLTGSKVVRLPEDPDHEYYIPGYILQKIGFVVLNVLIVTIAFVDIIPKLWIIGFGEMRRAEVVAMVKTLSDESSTEYRNDAEAKAVMDEDDYSSKYHNILSFRLASGERHEVRMPTGSRHSPPYNILDISGLPTIVLIAYSPRNPDRIVLPARLGTWFFPVIIVMFGLSAGVVSILYLMNATKPIQVPNLRLKDQEPETKMKSE